MEEILGKAQIIRRIHNAALSYKQYLMGKTYMFVFENNHVEVMFKKSTFKHLSGVDTNLNAIDFFKHAIKRNGLRPSEVFFSEDHPFDLAEKKTEHLSGLYKLTIENIKIATDIQTATFTYGLGITNLEVVLCLGPDCDENGNLKSQYMVPYSFRIEEMSDDKYKEIYDVTHIFVKGNSSSKYTELTFGDVNTIKNIQDKTKLKLDETLSRDKDN